MKKVLVLVMVAALATAASAALLSEDFTTDPGFTSLNPVPNPALGQWYKSPNGANYNSGDGAVRLVNPGGDGGISSIMIVQSGADLVAGQTYDLTLDHSFADDGATRLFADVWDVDYGTGTVSVQTRKWDTWNGGDLNDLAVTGDATAFELIEGEWGGGNLGLHTLSFVYDGSGDIVVRVGSHRSGKTGWHRADVSSVEIAEGIPEPATMALLGLGALIGIKRRK